MLKPVVREAWYSDCEQIGALMRRNGISENELSTDEWAALWRDNPARPDDQSIPIGWVLEQAGMVVGYLGNIPQRYYYQGRRFLATVARGFAVDVEYRSQSLRLAATFFSQKNVDLLLNTTANASAGSVFQLFKAGKLPQPDYDKVLFWIIDGKGFVGSVLRKRGYSSGLAGLGGALISPALHIEGRLRRRRPIVSAARCEVNVLEPQNLDEEFESFWQSTLAQRPQCLLADRSRRTLRWHFNHRGADARHTRFICARRLGKLVGYLALTRVDSPEIGLRRSRVADLVAEHDDPALVDALLCAAVGQARADGSHILELVGFPARIRARCVAAKAYMRPFPVWQFWYKAISTKLQESLRDEAAWYGSSYDGDASL